MTLRAYIKSKRLTQAQFAELAKVPASQVSLWLKAERGEEGGRRPGIANATKIEKATGGKVPVSSWLRAARPVRSDASSAADSSPNQSR